MGFDWANFCEGLKVLASAKAFIDSITQGLKVRTAPSSRVLCCHVLFCPLHVLSPGSAMFGQTLWWERLAIVNICVAPLVLI